jgi:hypothetical protein
VHFHRQAARAEAAGQRLTGEGQLHGERGKGVPAFGEFPRSAKRETIGVHAWHVHGDVEPSGVGVR